MDPGSIGYSYSRIVFDGYHYLNLTVADLNDPDAFSDKNSYYLTDMTSPLRPTMKIRGDKLKDLIDKFLDMSDYEFMTKVFDK